MTDKLALEGLLVTPDIAKSFHSVNHCVLLQVLQKFGYGEGIFAWIKAMLKDQESCIINGGKTKKYFKLERCAGQEIRYLCICLYLFYKYFYIRITLTSKV